MKRFIRSCIIAAVSAALFVFLPLVSYADTANGISVTESALERGDEFAVTLSVPPAENADTASVKVRFDDTAFEVVEWNPVLPGSFANSGSGTFLLSAANVERLIDLSGGITMTAKLRVKNTAADGSYDIVLADSSFCYVRDNGYEFEELWFPDVTNVTVTVGDAGMIDVENSADVMEVGERNISVNTADSAVKSSDKGGGMNPMVVAIIVIAIILVAIVVAVLIINAMNKK